MAQTFNTDIFGQIMTGQNEFLGIPTDALPEEVPIQLPLTIGNEFPRLQRFVSEKRIDIQRGTGDNFAEVFFKGETDSPDPTKHIVQVRDVGSFNEQTVATADLLHFFGGKEGGKPLNPEFFKLKQEFIKNMTPEQNTIAKRQLNDARKGGATGTNFSNFNNFIQQVSSDELIRGGLFPELMTRPAEREAFKNREPFNKKQNDILNKMDKLIRSE